MTSLTIDREIIRAVLNMTEKKFADDLSKGNFTSATIGKAVKQLKLPANSNKHYGMNFEDIPDVNTKNLRKNIGKLLNKNGQGSYDLCNKLDKRKSLDKSLDMSGSLLLPFL